jgi:D-glucuronyl C5-epimerase C-terminus
LEFLDDGFPSRRRDDHTVLVNPIFGKYAIQDFLLQYEQTGHRRFLEAAATVGRATVARMEDHNGALAFYYDEGVRPVRNRDRHYSGLTQSHYLVAFQKLFELTGDPAFADAAQRVLTSLLIGVDQGGVIYERGYGRIIAETPSRPNDVILNGWLTAMLNVYDYSERAGSREAKELFDANVAALEHDLPLFDVPALRNSRYGSAGYAYFRIVLPSLAPDAAPYSVTGIRLDVPGEPPYPVDELDGTRWELYVFESDLAVRATERPTLKRRTLRLNLVLNYLSYPRPNRLSLNVESPREGNAVLQMLRGGYSPVSAAPSGDREWVEIGVTPLNTGKTRLEWPIPWDVADIVAYPTSFLKLVEGRHYNVYHFLHIDQLRRLSAVTGSQTCLRFADEWTRYVDECWPEMELYAAVETGPSPHRGHPYSS